MAGIDPISNVADSAGKIAQAASAIISIFKASATAKQAGEIQMDEIALQGQIQMVLAQIAVNQEEAKSLNWFVAGWRPFIGWVCGLGLAYGLILKPLAQTLLVIFHVNFDVSLLPTLDAGTIMGLLVPMLGLGVMRTFEKTKDAAGNH